ncbi:hypothetical protein ABZ915_34050 [Streptomyces sp. NPDC046915]|uniref:hypothetical protein n=1 Tax=Streptomyces sp. NPDC046915 TaxID=3155257 RepID=UPI0033E35B2B
MGCAGLRQPAVPAAAEDRAGASRPQVMLKGAGISGLNPEALAAVLLHDDRHRRLPARGTLDRLKSLSHSTRHALEGGRSKQAPRCTSASRTASTCRA